MRLFEFLKVLSIGGALRSSSSLNVLELSSRRPTYSVSKTKLDFVHVKVTVFTNCVPYVEASLTSDELMWG